MFPLAVAELGDFLIKGMREFVFLGEGGFYKVDASARAERRMAGTKGMGKGWGGRDGGSGEKSMANERKEEGEGGKNLDDDKCFLRWNVIYAVIRIVATNHPYVCVGGA